tara:strand:+ start:757 stop:1089 length:333 start_codon:yes stop_codon:yes gene_type:complete
MSKINEDKISPIVLDFTKADKVNESWLKSFGTAIKIILNNMFGGSNVPVSIRGTEKDISSFRNAISAERDYIASFRKYGLDNPATYRTKSVLDQRVKKFERATGLKWPFK